MAEQPGYSMPIPGFGSMQQSGQPYQTPEDQARQEQEYVRAEEARASSQVTNAKQAAQQRINDARTGLETQREQARSQMKEQELVVMAEERRQQLEYSRLQQTAENEAAAFNLQLQQIEGEVAQQEEMGARIRVASTRAQAPWVLADAGSLTPPPMPVRR